MLLIFAISFQRSFISTFTASLSVTSARKRRKSAAQGLRSQQTSGACGCDGCNVCNGACGCDGCNVCNGACGCNNGPAMAAGPAALPANGVG